MWVTQRFSRHISFKDESDMKLISHNIGIHLIPDVHIMNHLKEQFSNIHSLNRNKPELIQLSVDKKIHMTRIQSKIFHILFENKTGISIKNLQILRWLLCEIYGIIFNPSFPLLYFISISGMNRRKVCLILYSDGEKFPHSLQSSRSEFEQA